MPAASAAVATSQTQAMERQSGPERQPISRVPPGNLQALVEPKYLRLPLSGLLMFVLLGKQLITKPCGKRITDHDQENA
jgi:hypothetical protein